MGCIAFLSKKLKFMQTINQIRIILIVVILTSCNEKKSSTLQILSLENKVNTKDYFTYNNLVKDISVVELETGPGKYISGVTKVYVTKNSSILLLNGSTEVYEYNKNGGFIKKIGRTGRGPGEYSEAKDFCISNNELTISILTRLAINMYNVNDGSFDRKIDITPFRKDDFLPEFIIDDGNHGYFLWASNPSKVSDFSKDFFLLWHINKEGKVVDKLLKRTEFVMEILRFTKSYDGNYFIRPLEGTNELLKLSSGKLINYISIEFGDKYIPKNYFSQFDNEPYINLDKWIKSNYYKMPYEFYDTQDHLFFLFGGPNGSTFSCLYDKRDKKTISAKLNSNNPSICFADSTHFYACINSSYIDVNKMDSVFKTKLDTKINNEKIFILKFKINEN